MDNQHHCNRCPYWYVTKKKYPSGYYDITLCRKYNEQLYYLAGEENKTPHPCNICSEELSYVSYIEFERNILRRNDMGTNYYLVKNRPSIDSGLHIGKSSAGWRFLFHKPSIWETDVPLNTFEAWRDYLKEQTENGSYVIMNEYDEVVDYDWLMNLIESKQTENRPDMFEYCENVNGYRFASGEFS